MATLFVLCGFIGSGKTTFAKRVEAETGAVRFTIDEWMIPLFGEHMSREEMNYRIAFFEDRFKKLALRFLEHGVDVIFDFGAWTRSARQEMRCWAKSARADLRMVHFAASLEECKLRAVARTRVGGQGAYSIDEATFDIIASLYERPGADEHFDTIVG